MLLSRLFALCVACLFLAGCGATLSEQNPAFEKLGQVTVNTENSRQGQLFRHEMERLLARHDEQNPRYEVSADISFSYPEDAVDMKVVIAVYDTLTGQNILNKTFLSSASVGGVASLYGSEAAKNNALERLAVNSAQKAYRYLVLFFSQQGDLQS